MKDIMPRRDPTTNNNTGKRLPYAKPRVLSSSGQLQAVLGTGCAVVCTPSNIGDPPCGGIDASDPLC